MRELTLANAQLQDLDRMKDQFLATLSHELRTPLTSLLGYLELFDRGMLGPLTPQQEEAVRVMRRSSEVLARQLNNLLYFQEVRSRSLNFVQLQPLDILRPLIAAARERAAQAQLQFEVLLSEMQPIEVDRSAFEHLVRNLLDNAFQYTEPGGRVRFIVRDEPTRLIIRVEDTGIGIPAGEQEKIFLPFYQVDHSLARGHPGSGLGLAIVRHIVEAHGGQIALRSAPGEGSAFTIAIPRRQVAAWVIDHHKDTEGTEGFVKSLCVLCASVVNTYQAVSTITTETQRAQRVFHESLCPLCLRGEHPPTHSCRQTATDTGGSNSRVAPAARRGFRPQPLAPCAAR
ncbi:MAG: hypothetical protein KatS3mg056_0987 [Chloroflexus sp.]|nr:MAG: hypothetical protein KatS3mg056_0987 [Chloroflexus sp.]